MTKETQHALLERDIVKISPSDIKGKLCEALIDDKGAVMALILDENPEYYLEAVNNHYRLKEENEKLRQALLKIVEREEDRIEQEQGKGAVVVQASLYLIAKEALEESE